ncbi:MAG: rRNA pseudouridine synthase [Clostridia bacterium]|nr:rRNA pseudouridine synthase [Clostridia bacterium]
MQKIRIQKYFSDCGLMSRRAAEKAISDGEVSLNGHPAHIGDSLDPAKDIVTYRGTPVVQKKREHTYIMLNKPRGYITSMSDPNGRKCVTELLSGVKTRVYPIGRLDLISEGLLLLTDDGELANRLTHPKHSIPKIYRVKVAGAVSEEQLDTLRSELVIDGYQIEPVTVSVHHSDESGTTLAMELYEGRNRQIRKMCEQANLTVKRLNRVGIGKLRLNGLAVGKWRALTDEELRYIKKASGLCRK